MDPSNNARISSTQRQQLLDADLQRRLSARFGFVRAKALTTVLKKISHNNLAIEDQVLRSWGIR